MNTIELRAWDNITGEMIYTGNGFMDRCMKYAETCGCSDECSAVIGVGVQCPHLVFMLYTGREDIRGVKVYEGDIVMTSWGLGVVDWSDAFAGFYAQQGTSYISLADISPLEVYGNQYEDPKMVVKV